jgi:hypothetical protein
MLWEVRWCWVRPLEAVRISCPCSADSWRRLVWRRNGVRRRSGRPTFSALFINLLLGPCLFYLAPFFDPSAKEADSPPRDIGARVFTSAFV